MFYSLYAKCRLIGVFYMITILSSLFIKNRDQVGDGNVRRAYGMLCSIVGIALNVCLFAGKYLAGAISGSIAITADAFNNLSDAGSSFISLVGFKFSGMKADADHPFGHGRIEYVSGFGVSMIIILMGFELLKTSVGKIFHPEPVETSALAVGILIVSICVKAYMFFYNRSVGTKIQSETMKATAMDSMSDSIATTAVLVSMGIAYATGVNVDGWCGCLVACFVLYAGYGAAKDTLNPLLGEAPSKEFVDEIKSIVLAHPEILGIHDLVVHNYGPGRVMLSVHVEVPAEGDILHMHDMIDNIEHRLHRELNCSAVIHMDPVSVGDERTNELKEKVREIINGMQENIHFHDFRIVDGPTHTNVIFDVEVPYSVKTEDKENVSYLQKKIRELGSDGQEYYAVIDVDRDLCENGNRSMR